jgi:two-component system chemotaxis response regulator CheB
MIVSSLAEEGAEQTVAALALGAADTLPKPGKGQFNGRFSEILVSKLKALGYAAAPVIERAPAPKSGVQPVLRSMPADPIDILAIGASTGGIHALGVLFHSLPKRIGVPILVTQHLPPPFMPVFARQLGTIAGRECLVAEDGMRLRPDLIVLAPGDAHLTVEPIDRTTVVRLTHGRSVSGCMPSLDPMFASVGAVFNTGALGVVLTGIGRDGVEGASRMVACGGAVIAQDEASCAVWGMPRAILEAGLACAVLPPDKIARRISGRTEEHPTCR